MANWPQVSIDTKKEWDMCFVCGVKNPIGLRVVFNWDGKVATGEFKPSRLHQGWSGLVHGGIIACLLDEAMSFASYSEGLSTITARMQSRFKRALPIDEPLIITGRVTKKTRKLAETAAEIALKDGSVVADGTATMFIFR